MKLIKFKRVNSYQLFAIANLVKVAALSSRLCKEEAGFGLE